MQRQKKMYRSVIIILAAAAVFLVMYFLCFPAFTLERQKTDCGVQAHSHDAHCYEETLICGREETSAHTHGDACYEEKQTLICEIEDPEHEHTDACYEAEKVLICGQEETEGHTHSDACYERKLVCSKEEHEHTGACSAAETDAEKTETKAEEEEPAEQSESTKKIYSYEDSVLTAEAVPAAGTVLPENAKLQVREIPSDSKAYETYEKLLKENHTEAAADEPARIAEPKLLAYDIGFYEDGREIEPENGSIAVKLTFKKEQLNAEKAEDVSLYHVVENGRDLSLETVKRVDAQISADAAVRELAFEADSFSVYLVRLDTDQMSKDLEYKVISQDTDTFTHTEFYRASNPLGIAGHFHIVAFDEAHLDAHTNGNVLARNLYANSNFGTNNYGSEISYAQNYKQINPTSAADPRSVLVLGSEHEITLQDNGNKFAVNGTGMNNPKRIWQDEDTGKLAFIDFERVKAECRNLSADYQTFPSQNVTENIVDNNNQNLVLTNAAVLGVYNTTLGELNRKYGSGTGSTIKVQGFSQGRHGTLLVNIDCQGARDVYLPNIRLYVDGKEQNIGETTTDVNGKVILNFIHAEDAILHLSQTHATVIAPESTVYVNQNLNGTIIGKNVYIKAESHRTDFSGIDPEQTVRVKAVKKWKDAAGNWLTAEFSKGFSATVQLVCTEGDKTYVVDEVVLNEENGWNHIWTGLPTSHGEKYEVKEISYTVTDEKEYEASVAETVTEDGTAITLTNKEKTEEKPQVLNLNVIKTWKDADGNTMESGYPDSIEVTLYRKTETGSPQKVETVTITAKNNWQYAWSNLAAADEAGNAFTYYIEERVPEDYESEYQNNGITGTSDEMTIQLVNKKKAVEEGFELPETGGIGTGVFSAAGGLLSAAALLILLFRKKTAANRGLQEKK